MVEIVMDAIGRVLPHIDDKACSSGIHDGVFIYENRLLRVGVIRPDSQFIPVLDYQSILPEYRIFLPVRDKYVVLLHVLNEPISELKALALVDYQEPISEAVLPYINEWYRRHLELHSKAKTSWELVRQDAHHESVDRKKFYNDWREEMNAERVIKQIDKMMKVLKNRN